MLVVDAAQSAQTQDSVTKEKVKKQRQDFKGELA